jgi:hypothetical protein
MIKPELREAVSAARVLPAKMCMLLLNGCLRPGTPPARAVYYVTNGPELTLLQEKVEAA